MWAWRCLIHQFLTFKCVFLVLYVNIRLLCLLSSFPAVVSRPCVVFFLSTVCCLHFYFSWPFIHLIITSAFFLSLSPCLHPSLTPSFLSLPSLEGPQNVFCFFQSLEWIFDVFLHVGVGDNRVVHSGSELLDLKEGEGEGGRERGRNV